MKSIELTEYQPKFFKLDELEEAIAKLIHKNYNKQVKVDFSPFQKQWKLTAKSWVGNLPLTPDVQMCLHPKVPISNLFRMLEYAYNLQSFKLLEGSVQCDTIDDFYSRLAQILAQKILDRSRKGFYRTYLNKTNLLPYVRGKVDFQYQLKHPGTIKLKCDYQDYTADIEDNQILFWTLYVIGRSGLCFTQVSTIVRKAYHVLQGLVTSRQFKGEDCINRSYNRLNQDYQTLHSLCRFFLDHCGAAHSVGNYTMLPFLVNTDKLYEQFVAAWLKQHLPDQFELKVQESLAIGKTIKFYLDLVIEDKITKKPVFILDTKYKIPESKPANEDIYQAIAYATSKGCENAVLVYPQPLKQPLNEQVTNSSIHLRSLSFSLDGDLEVAGQAFLNKLFKIAL